MRTAGARHLLLFRRSGEAGAMRAGGLESDAAVLAVGFDAAGRRAGELAVR